MCCRPPPHDAWAGGSFAAITRSLLRPGCGRLAARLAGPTYSRMACQQRQRRDNVRPTQPLERHRREKLAQHAIKRQLWAFLSSQGEHFRTRTHISPRRVNFFAHRTQPRADCETNDTSAATDAGQHETAVTTATEKCAKNTYFSPAKAMAVSTDPPHRPAKATPVSTPRTYKRAKATPVSRERFQMPVGGGRARAKQKSHIISRGHFLSLSTNVAIATMRIQSLK